MEPKAETVADQVKSGEYFKDAIAWYRYKYINPFSHRTYLFVLMVLVFVIFSTICLSIYNMYPTSRQVQYTINATVEVNKTAKIIRADHIGKNPQLSVTDILVKNYIKKHESFNYGLMSRQFKYLKNNSSRIIFNDFYKLMSINNPNSPVLKYKKSLLRKIEITDAVYNENSEAIIKYTAIITNKSGSVISTEKHLVKLSYEIDQINPNLVHGDPFNFIVTKYQTKKLSD